MESVLEDVDPDFLERPVPLAELSSKKRRRAADVLLDTGSDLESEDEDILEDSALDWRAKQI